MHSPAAARVPFVGLTGGLGAGKSTALAILEDLGAVTLSADAVVHELLGTDELRDALVRRLGDGVVRDGVVDRGVVAERVFTSPEHRDWIEGELWPRVGERIAHWREQTLVADPRPAAAVVESPLLFEAGMEGRFDHTVAVIAEERLRERRAAARGHQAVAERGGRQLTQEEKSQRADFTVRNDGTEAELRGELSRVLATITAEV